MGNVFLSLFQNLRKYQLVQDQRLISACVIFACTLVSQSFLSSKNYRPFKLYLKLCEISEDLDQIRARIIQAVNIEYNSFSNAC